MKLNETGKGTEIIKCAAQAYAITGGAPSKLLKEAAEWLLDCFRKTGDPDCIEAAGEITRAYMEMGLLDQDEDVFDEILECLGTTREKQFPKALYCQNRLRVNASSVREVLGRWPKAGGAGDSVEWVVRDIVTRVKKGEVGCWQYRRGASGVVFELLVLEAGSYLMDMEKKKVYLFEKSASLNDAND